MKTITFTLSADGENLGSFTLDPYTQLRLMADAKANPKLSLTDYVREALRDVTLRDDYRGTIHCCDEGGDIAAVSEQLAAASQA
jgi:hypothetical protein